MTAPAIERRRLSTEVELRTTSTGSKVIDGYSPVYGRLSEDLGGFVEMVEPGAASRRLGDDIFGLFNHDASMVLGRNLAQTMRLAEDEKGVHYEIDVPDTTLGRDMVTSIERGDITGSSFSFTILEDRLDVTEAGYPLRRIVSFRQLFDVGPVTFPAYPDAPSGTASRHLRSLLERHTDTLHRSLDELIGLDADGLADIIRDPDASLDRSSKDSGDTGLHVGTAEIARARLRLAEIA